MAYPYYLFSIYYNLIRNSKNKITIKRRKMCNFQNTKLSFQPKMKNNILVKLYYF